jgi:hypothetical protein
MWTAMNKRMEDQYKFNISIDARGGGGWIERYERVIEMVMKGVLIFLRRKFET